MDLPPWATPAACQASAFSVEGAAKPTVAPLAQVAGSPSIGSVTEKIPVGVM
jgi:hypothetical protein